MKDHLSKTLAEIKEAGLYKEERLIESAQQAAISVKGKEVLNFCANNYLGLSNHPRLIAAAQQIMERRGYGMSSVRFICGTQDIHKELEAAISDYFKTEDTILYAACFDANGGVFEPLFTEEDAIISDSLNHASIIDGVRLCKAKRYRYANADMADLERCLQEAQAQRFRIVVTDGVFSMDGNVAPMDCICDLAEKYDALVMVDESHSAGVVGPTGHGVSEQYGTYGRVDIYTGTLGKAFGGALRRLGFALCKAAPERSGVKGCPRQPPPIGAQRRFVRGSVGALEAVQHRETLPRSRGHHPTHAVHSVEKRRAQQPARITAPREHNLLM